MHAIIAIVVLSASTALTHAYLDAGWHSKSEIDRLASQLRELPDSIGDWNRTAKNEIPNGTLRTLKCYGYLSESYENSSSGAVISVAVLFGPRGPIAVHTPEICYSSAGTEPVAPRKVSSIETGTYKDEFWMTRFSKKGLQEPSLEVWYAWSDGGPWRASENPRYWMTDHLYKLQLSGKPSKGGGVSDCQSFLQSFLPVLRKQLATH